MKRILFLFLLASACVSCDQTKKSFLESGDAYFGLTPPGLIPEVFAPGIVSDSSWAEHCQLAVSPKGDEIYWSAWSSQYPPTDTSKKNSEQMYFSEFKEGSWTKPALAEFTKDHLTNLNGGPVFSPDGSRLYFYSVDRPGGFGDMDTWYVDRTETGWSKPINVGEPYNSSGDDWTPIFTSLGNAYKNFGRTIKYKYENGTFSNPDTIVIYEGFRPIFPVFISPDESYALFDAVKEDGFGHLDLYISFKDENNHWEYPINMGNKINSEVWERFPMVSPDGKYFFFMKHTKTQDFFWVSTEIFTDLKNKHQIIEHE